MMMHRSLNPKEEWTNIKTNINGEKAIGIIWGEILSVMNMQIYDNECY